MTMTRAGLWLVAALLNSGSQMVAAQPVTAAGTDKTAALAQQLRGLASASDGRVGICAGDVTTTTMACVNGDERFPMQSVMKLVVATVVMDAVDAEGLKLSDVIVLRPEDASPGPQDLANLVRARGRLEASVDELIRRAVADSDSTSVDVLMARLGGTAAVQAFLQRKQVTGIRIDRDERHLQAESVGLIWRPAFADDKTFQAAIAALPTAKRDAAWSRYLIDPRDTATPMAMAGFLTALTTGKLLSPASTKHLLAVMASTVTGADRLKAGLPPGWKIGHKTGTGRQWQGMTSDTNDVGILTAPDGRTILIAVFVAQSRGSNEQRAAVIAESARLVTSAYQTK